MKLPDGIRVTSTRVVPGENRAVFGVSIDRRVLERVRLQRGELGVVLPRWIERAVCRLGYCSLGCRGRVDHTVVDGHNALVWPSKFTTDGRPPRLPRR